MLHFKDTVFYGIFQSHALLQINHTHCLKTVVQVQNIVVKSPKLHKQEILDSTKKQALPSTSIRSRNMKWIDGCFLVLPFYRYPWTQHFSLTSHVPLLHFSQDFVAFDSGSWRFALTNRKRSYVTRNQSDWAEVFRRVRDYKRPRPAPDFQLLLTLVS